jgi:hypothetical protein
MKPPTEADLQELENTALLHYREKSDEDYWFGFGRFDRIVQTLEYLIARARYHNARQSQRNGKSEPVPSLQPKPKKAKR